MADVRVVPNAVCLRCESVEKEMVRVGPMFFCSMCFKVEFLNTMSITVINNKQSVSEESLIYQKWLKIYKELWI